VSRIDRGGCGNAGHGGFLSGIYHRGLSQAQEPLEVKCPSGIDAIAVVYGTTGAGALGEIKARRYGQRLIDPDS
jgi:hypothetical protein